jgi:myo-inositol 2-dehydrogenase / D-chiro-inositol 1-dehydrogenase
MARIRIGLVGAGLIGGAHSAVLRTIADAIPDALELTAVADPLAEHRGLFTQLYGYRHAFADGRKLLDGAEVDAIFVCTPTVFHAEVVHAAAAAGKHLFCEKPLAMSHAEAGAMGDAVRRAGVRAQIGLVLRFSAIYTVMRDLLRTSDVGEPTAVLFRDDQAFPIRGVHHTAWRKDRRLTAGGTLIEHGVHDLDLLTWFFGPIARLRAWQQNRAGHAGIEDYVAVELEFASGLRAQLVSLWHDMLQRPSNRRLEIFCRRGYFASDHDMVGDIAVQLGDGPEQHLDASAVLERFEALLGRADPRFRDWYPVPYLLQDLEFIEALLADRDPTPGLEVGIEAQRIAETVYHAAQRGEEVELLPPAR